MSLRGGVEHFSHGDRHGRDPSANNFPTSGLPGRHAGGALWRARQLTGAENLAIELPESSRWPIPAFAAYGNISISSGSCRWAVPASWQPNCISQVTRQPSLVAVTHHRRGVEGHDAGLQEVAERQARDQYVQQELPPSRGSLEWSCGRRAHACRSGGSYFGKGSLTLPPSSITSHASNLAGRVVLALRDTRMQQIGGIVPQGYRSSRFFSDARFNRRAAYR